MFKLREIGGMIWTCAHFHESMQVASVPSLIRHESREEGIRRRREGRGRRNKGGGVRRRAAGVSEIDEKE